MKVVAVIPARYESTRFPGKPLHKIAGRPLLQWVIEGSRESRLIDHLLVATDDKRIADLCKELSVDCEMTSPNCATGTDRILEALRKRPGEVIINIQGDEPLIEGWVLDKIITPMIEDPQIEMATLAERLSEKDIINPNAAKIVVNSKNRALYFSRFGIPFSRNIEARHEIGLKHIGIYAYRRSFLEKFCRQGPVPLELSEGLEQLRALYLGAQIQVITVEHESRGVDTPEDVLVVERLLRIKNKGVLK